MADPGFPRRGAPTPEVKVKTLLPTARESNVLRSVCLFTRVGGMISLSVSGPMFSPRGVYLLGGVCLLGGVFWRIPVVTSSGSHCSGRYTFYWNAFLFGKTFAKNCLKMKEIGPRGWRSSLVPLPPLVLPMNSTQFCLQFPKVVPYIIALLL